MMRALIIALAMLMSSQALAQVPWDKLPNLKGITLTDQMKTRAEGLMKAENCYHQCPDTIYQCVVAAQPATTALRLAGLIARLVAEGAEAQDITKELANRARSAHPFKAAQIDLSDAPVLGSGNARVKVVIFADFDCPYCHVISPRLVSIVRAMPQDVDLYFKHFPVKAHGPRAITTSQAGRAAQLQGRFWEFHDLMYEHFEQHEDEDILTYAEKLGLDKAAFSRDMGSDQALDHVRNSKREGVKLGVKSTPTIFINGKRYYARKDEFSLRDRLEEELENLKAEGK